MECPYCHSQIKSQVKKFCPVCGQDIEAYGMRTQQMPVNVSVPSSVGGWATSDASRQTQGMPDITIQAPPVSGSMQGQQRSQGSNQGSYNWHGAEMSSYGSSKSSDGRSGAVPFESSVNGTFRSFNTVQKPSTPKWPIFLIVGLIILIVALVLLILRPWESQTASTDTPQQDVSTQQQSEQTQAQGTGEQQTQETETQTQTVSGEQAQQEPGPADQTGGLEAEVAVLTDAYGQLAGFDAQISDTANEFNESYLSEDQGFRQERAAAAAQLLAQIEALKGSVDALDAKGSQGFESARSQVSEMLNCLVMRASVLSEAWSRSAAAANPREEENEIIAPLLRDNDENGVNRYKTRYLELYGSFDLGAALAEV